MNALWDHYWPALTLALVIGVVGGAIAFRSRTRKRRGWTLVAAALAVLAVLAIWHGPVGTARRFTSITEAQVRLTLDAFEMTQVQAQLERAPLKRTLVLSGPADDFQRSELVRIMDTQPGVANARWTDTAAPATLPLLGEVELAGLVAFGLGLLWAYLLELRRRSRAEWRW